MSNTNPYESPADFATSHGERHRTVNHELRFRVAAILHVIEALGVLLGIILLWNAGDWHEALPWAILAGFLCFVAQGLWHGKRWARLIGLIAHWLSAALFGLAFLGCVLLVASWPFTGGGIAQGLALVALIPLSIIEVLSLVTIKSLQLASDDRTSS